MLKEFNCILLTIHTMFDNDLKLDANAYVRISLRNKTIIVLDRFSIFRKFTMSLSIRTPFMPSLPYIMKYLDKSILKITMLQKLENVTYHIFPP